MTSEQIREWLRSVTPPGADRPLVDCTVTGPIAKRDNSWLFQARCEELPAAAAVKLCLVPHTAEPDPQSAQRQFDALARARAAMASPLDFGVPQPFFVDPGHGLVGVEWISGDALTDLVFSRPCSPDRAKLLMRRAGSWLHYFHASHPLPPTQLDVAEKLENLARLQSERAVPDEVFQRAIELLRRTAPAAAAMPLPCSWLHGDFKADNIMIAGERTVGIDVHLRHENAAIYDIAPFVNHIELRLCHPSSWRFFFSRQLLQDAFLDGYHGARSGPPEPPLSWVRMYLLLGEWRTARNAGRSRARRVAIDWCYRGVASRLSAALDRC